MGGGGRLLTFESTVLCNLNLSFMYTLLFTFLSAGILLDKEAFIRLKK